MADLDKVMKGLNCCKNSYPKDCKHCPYEKDCTHDGTCDLLVRNAISVIAYQRMEIERLKKDLAFHKERGDRGWDNLRACLPKKSRTVSTLKERIVNEKTDRSDTG